MRNRILAAILAMSAVLLTACGASSSAVGSVPPQTAEKETGKSIRNIYLAGPFFNDTEIANIEKAEEVLTERGLSFFSPMRHTVDAEPGTTEWADGIFEMDRGEIEKADAVVAMYYGSNSDSGTAWECGYATAIGKPVILVHVNEDGDSNLMMHCGSTTNIFLKDLAAYDFDTMPVYEYEGKMF